MTRETHYARWGSTCGRQTSPATRAFATEVLASGTVRDLVAGSGLQFAERGVHSLKGVPGEWRLYAVDRALSTG